MPDARPGDAAGESNAVPSRHRRDGIELLPQHAAMLAASAISPEVAKARGYRTIRTKSELERLGFKPSQRRVPALLIPIRDVHGQLVTYQLRPDTPRVGRNGRIIKYETPSGSRLVIDVHPTVRGRLGDPKDALFVTEGAKKVDAAVSIGLCCVGLLGVFGWRGTSANGGKTALPDWELIALNGRTVYVAFDSDVLAKRQVYAALGRLKALLGTRGAHVKVIYLPPGELGGKTGLDDFLASGKTAQDLLSLAADELRPPPESEDDDSHKLLAEVGPYRERRDGIYRVRFWRDEEIEERLTNFCARIVGEIVRDDGQETQNAFEIEAGLEGRTVRLTVPAVKFLSMGWPMEYLGAKAVVAAGFGARDQTREAIQLLSKDVVRRRIFTHTGWVKLGHDWLYLHASGAIGTKGTVADVEIDLPREISRHRLPDPPGAEERIKAVRASLKVLDVAPDRITIPLFCSIYRAPLGPCDSSIHAAGDTGVGKSEVTALCAQHYGPEMDRLHLTSWASTGNALETIAFHAKDALLVVDDFAPGGTQYDVARLHREADRILRAQGNRSGRARLSGDGTLRVTRAPRGIILSSGEDIPRGASIRARCCVLEVGRDDVRWDLLTLCQADARNGLYAASMAGYLQFVAGRHDAFFRATPERVVELRARAHTSEGHRRTASLVAELMVGFEVFISYALESKAIDCDEAERLLARAWKALGEAAELHGRRIVHADPVAKLLDLLPSAIASGEAHIAEPSGKAPKGCAGFGWQYREGEIGDKTKTEWVPQGRRVGWIDGDDLFLDLNAAVKAVQTVAGPAGDGIAVGVRTLLKRLDERGLLVSKDVDRGRLTVRRTLEGVRRDVIHLRLATMYPPIASSQSSHSPNSPPAGGRDGRAPDGATSPEFDLPSQSRPASGAVGTIGTQESATHLPRGKSRGGGADGGGTADPNAPKSGSLGPSYQGGREPEELRGQKPPPSTPLLDSPNREPGDEDDDIVEGKA